MAEKNEYLDYSGANDQFTGGINMIPVTTPKGEFNVWTKRGGNNPGIRVLLLHYGAGTHDRGHLRYDGPETYEMDVGAGGERKIFALPERKPSVSI